MKIFYLLGEQDCILQVNLTKEVAFRTVNNQLKFLLKLYWIGLKVKNVYFAPDE